MSFFDRLLEEQRRIKDSGLSRQLVAPKLHSFVHNDYLDLARHPSLVEAGRRGFEEAGAGSRGSRLLGGHSELFERVEKKIAEFFCAPSALIFSSGYLANLGVVRSLAQVADWVISDEHNHASLIDAVRLSGKPKWICPHNQWQQVAPLHRGPTLLLVAESLYSMEGDFVNWEALQRCLYDTDSFLILDEAHAAGVFGENGRGVSENQVDWSRMAVVVTFGKAFGVAGAAVLCHPEIREHLINHARSFIYTTAPSPVVVAMIEQSLTLVRDEKWRREELQSRSRRIRKLLNADESASPIIPFAVPGNDRALRFSQSMRESGFDLRAIRYPTVGVGKERVRISINLGVSWEDTERMAQEMVKRWKAFS